MSILSVLTPSNVSVALLLGAATLLAMYLYDYFYGSPLSSLPPSSLSGALPIKNLRKAISGKIHILSWEGHQKHGSVFRILNGMIAIADPQLVHRLVKQEDIPKNPRIYSVLKFRRTDPDNIFMTTDRVFHKRSRKLATPAFSIKYLNNLEPYMTSVWDSCERKIKSTSADAQGWRKFDLNKAFHNIAMDIIGETAFGESFGMVEHGSHPMLHAREATFKFGMTKAMFNFIDYIPYKLLPIRKAFELQDAFVAAMIEKRQKMNAAGERRSDILQFLLDHRDPVTGEKADLEEIGTQTFVFFAAGSETSSNTMCWVMYYLNKNPHVFKKMQAELDAAFPDGLTKPLDLTTLRGLPYLDAVLKETSRCRPVAPTIARVFEHDSLITAYDSDGKASEHLIPAGTQATVSIWTLQNSPKLWLRADEFLPERWMEEGVVKVADEEAWGVLASKEELSSSAGAEWGKPKLCNKEAFMTFSAGSRDCIGKNFAANEMKLTLGHLIRRFEVVPDYDVSQEFTGAAFITLQIDCEGGLPVKIRPRTA